MCLEQSHKPKLNRIPRDSNHKLSNIGKSQIAKKFEPSCNKLNHSKLAFHRQMISETHHDMLMNQNVKAFALKLSQFIKFGQLLHVLQQMCTHWHNANISKKQQLEIYSAKAFNQKPNAKNQQLVNSKPHAGLSFSHICGSMPRMQRAHLAFASRAYLRKRSANTISADEVCAVACSRHMFS